MNHASSHKKTSESHPLSGLSITCAIPHTKGMASFSPHLGEKKQGRSEVLSQYKTYLSHLENASDRLSIIERINTITVIIRNDDYKPESHSEILFPLDANHPFHKALIASILEKYNHDKRSDLHSALSD